METRDSHATSRQSQYSRVSTPIFIIDIPNDDPIT